MPSEDELRDYPDKEKLATIKVPSLQDRIVTVSIGVASLIVVVEKELDRCRSELEGQADIAMRYAKAGGRNTFRHYPDIINKYGAVLEHHPETNVVTIDIGRRLRVKVGQEFLVYHPDFMGKKAFIYKDGRTEKVLGTYPRFPIGRIIVFAVQEDISFCNLAEYKGKGSIPVGSGLEAVPLGSISHLIGQEHGIIPFEEPGFVPAEKLLNIVRSDAEQKIDPFVAVFILNESDVVINERGTAFTNEALARLFRAVKDEFPVDAKISQIRNTEFAIYLQRIKGPEIVKNIETTLSVVNNKYKTLASFSAGYFCYQLMDKKEEKDDKSEVESKYTLEYARYGAFIAAGKSLGTIKFKPSMANDIIYISRKKGLYLQAAEDYKILSEMGIRNADIENQIGLCAIEMSPPDLTSGKEAFERATKLDSKSSITWMNLGLTHYALGNRPDGGLAFHNGLKMATEGFEIPKVYFGSMAICLYAVYKKNPKFMEIKELHRLLLEAKNNLKLSFVNVSEDEINEGIETIERAMKDNG